jgi:hypothetical protein
MSLAVLHGHSLMLEDGSRKGDIPRYVRAAEPTVFVTVDPSAFLDHLQHAFQYDPTWHYTLTRANREIGDMGVSKVKLRTFGFRGEGVRKQRLHQCWDARSVSPTPFHKLILEELNHETLLAWAADVRAWAMDNDLELRNAFAGYAAQLLRDSRFYPEPRRRVPRATNEKARESLPGNLVQLYVPPGPDSYNVTAIDQRQAHHRIVQTLPLPDANTLFARGYYGNLDESPDGYYCTPADPLYHRTVNEPGVVLAGMHSRFSRRREYRLPVQDFNGFQRVMLYTNTIPFIEAHGSRIEGIYAAWTSDTADTGLARYGAWAQAELEHALTNRKRWLKPLLHSTYGLLAARPRPLEVGHRQAKGGKRTTFLLGAREFSVRAVTLPNWQPNIVNVIQRGMIEAETQIRSLTMAEELARSGCRVLHIHTDGMHVEGQLPLLPDDWSVTGLTRVTYIDRVSWVARERDCLPGRDQQARAEVISHYAQLHSAIREARSPGRSHRRLQRQKERADVETRAKGVR